MLLFDAETGTQRLKLPGLVGQVWGIAFSPDCSRVVTADHDGVKLWDALMGQELLRLEGPGESCHFLAFTPDGRRLIAANYNEVHVFDGTPLTD